MAGFDDLIPDSLPYLAIDRFAATAGMSWSWGYYIEDSTGSPVNMTTGYTATCTLVGTAVTPTVTFPATGQILCTVTPANSVNVSPGDHLLEVVVTRTSDSAKVCVVGAGDSLIKVKAKVTP